MDWTLLLLLHDTSELNLGLPHFPSGSWTWGFLSLTPAHPSSQGLVLGIGPAPPACSLRTGPPHLPHSCTSSLGSLTSAHPLMQDWTSGLFLFPSSQNRTLSLSTSSLNVGLCSRSLKTAWTIIGPPPLPHVFSGFNDRNAWLQNNVSAAK